MASEKPAKSGAKRRRDADEEEDSALAASARAKPAPAEPVAAAYDKDGVSFVGHTRTQFYMSPGAVIGAGHAYVIKFARQYGVSAHKSAAAAGHAPVIYGYWTLPGGWIGVLMSYVQVGVPDMAGPVWTLFDPAKSTRAMREAVVNAYCKAFTASRNVHGDLRYGNVLIAQRTTSARAASASATASAMEYNVIFLDFDWAGPVGTARYPLVINRNLPWARGVRAGGAIQSIHDIHTICGQVENYDE